MCERVLPPVQALLEVAKTYTNRERELTVEPLEIRMPKPKMMMREKGGGRVLVTGSAGVVESHNEFSYCGLFKCRRCSGDGS